MIREIGVELQAELREMGVPFPVINGPEPTNPATTFGRERIVIEYDVDGKDSFERPPTLSRNPSRRYVSSEACKVTLFVQSNVAGANVFEHRRKAKALRDRVICALELVCAKRDGRVSAFVLSGGGFITPTDLEGAPIPGGAAYELTFGFPRAIESRKWTGEARPEGNITAIGSTTKVFQPGDNAGAGETACGG